MPGSAKKSPSKETRLGHDEFTGRKLGKYEIACRLSQGGMSEVFLAFQMGAQGFRKYVVLKRILENIRTQPEVVRMFVQEAKISAGFSHSHIAQVFDLDEADGELFLVMEFIAGATLVEVARGCIEAVEPIPTGLSLRVAKDTALALHYAHNFVDAAGRAVPVIHRDVAEKNIMVTWEGTTKLLDFGIAKRLDIAGKTQIGTVKGTSGYMSPEQIRGEPVDGRSDVFSLGIVLHECLSGQRLFFRRSREEEMYAALHQEVHPPSRRNPEVTPALDAVVLRALARERNERFASARDFAKAIEAAAGNLIWEQDSLSKFMQRMFAQQRRQTRDFLSELSPIEGIDLAEKPKLPVATGTLPTKPERGVSIPSILSPQKAQAMGHDAPTDLAQPSLWKGEKPAPTPPVSSKSMKASRSHSAVDSRPKWRVLTRRWKRRFQERLATPWGMVLAGLLMGLVMASAVSFMAGWIKW